MKQLAFHERFQKEFYEMNPEEFEKELEKRGLPITKEKMNQFERYLEVLQEWNEKINLTTVTSQEEAYLKHFYDSLTVGLYVDFSDRVHSLCDIGSGAGFPSIPLKIMYPQLKVTIVDSLKKRIKFLETLTHSLNLKNISLYHDRAEIFGQTKQFRDSFDFVTARAVAKMSVLAELCLPITKKDGTFIAMKAASAPEELQEAKKGIATLGGKIQENKQFFLPNDGGERHIILIDKKKETPNKYPRKAGTPNKNPL